MAASTTPLKCKPTRQELRQHRDTMDEQFVRVEDINSGLTNAMEAYKVSEWTPFHPEHQAGSSGTHTYIHPHSLAPMGQPSVSVSSVWDTESEISWRVPIKGGAASNCGAGGAEGGAGGAGGASGDPLPLGDPPPPRDPPPSDHLGQGGRRMSRRQRWMKDFEFPKFIKIQKLKKFEGKPGDDFETWWIVVQVYIDDQPEKSRKDKGTIDRIRSLIDKYAAAWHTYWL